MADWRTGFTTIRGWGHADPRPLHFTKHAVERFEERIGRPATGQNEIERDFFSSQMITHADLLRRGYRVSNALRPEFFLDALGDCWVVQSPPSFGTRSVVTFLVAPQVAHLDDAFQSMTKFPATIQEAEAAIDAIEQVAAASEGDGDREHGRREQHRRLQLIRERWEIERARRAREQERQQRRSQRERIEEPLNPALQTSMAKRKGPLNALHITDVETEELVKEWRETGVNRIAALQGYPVEVGEWYAAPAEQKAYWRERAVVALATLVTPPDERRGPPFKLPRLDDELQRMVREAFLRAGWRIVDNPQGGFAAFEPHRTEQDTQLHQAHFWLKRNIPPSVSESQKQFLMGVAAAGEEVVYAGSPEWNPQITKKWLENRDFRRGFKAAQNVPPEIRAILQQVVQRGRSERKGDPGGARPSALLWVGAAVLAVIVISELARRAAQQQAAVAGYPMVQGFRAG